MSSTRRTCADGSSTTGAVLFGGAAASRSARRPLLSMNETPEKSSTIGSACPGRLEERAQVSAGGHVELAVQPEPLVRSVISSCIGMNSTRSVKLPFGAEGCEPSDPTRVSPGGSTMAMTVESTSMADGEPIPEMLRGRHADGRRQSRDGRAATSARTCDGRASRRAPDHSRSRSSIPTCRPTGTGWASRASRSATTRYGSSSLTGSSWTSRPRSTSCRKARAATVSSRTASPRRRPRRAASPARTATEACSRATRTSRGPTADGTDRSRRGTTSRSTATSRPSTRSTSRRSASRRASPSTSSAPRCTGTSSTRARSSRGTR